MLTTTPQSPSPTKVNLKSLSTSPAKLNVYQENIYGFGTQMTQRPQRIPKVVLDHLGMDVPSEQVLREIYQVFDDEGKGFIERDRFREVMKNSFDNFGAPMEDKDIDRLFRKLDAGDVKAQGNGKGDGKLSFDEFCVLILSKLKL